MLPYLENGMIILIGATTSNPYHAINPAIRSRCQIFELHPLSPDDIMIALKRALTDPRGLSDFPVQISDEALRHFAESSGGDVRAALNGLELAVLSTKEDENGNICITVEIAEECMQKRAFPTIKTEIIITMFYLLFKSLFAGPM